MVFGFRRSRKQISPAHEKVPGGTVLCGACFSSNSTFKMLLSCMSPLPWDAFIILSFARILPAPKVGAFLNQSPEKTADFQLVKRTLQNLKC